MLLKLMPFCLGSIMFAMGLGLQRNDFTRLIRQPRVVSGLLAGQILGLPLLAIAIILILKLPAMLALGLLLIALCPGGVTSNLFCQLSRGDTALSVSLTALSSLIGVFSLPILLQFGFSAFSMGDTKFELSLWLTIKQLITITLLPMIIGMTLSTYHPWFHQQGQILASRCSSLFFAIIVLLLWHQQWPSIQTGALSIGSAVIMLNIGAIGLALLLNKAINLKGRQAITSYYEIGLQNAALAFFVAFNILHEPQLATATTVYSVVMTISAAILLTLLRLSNKKAPTDGETSTQAVK
ncbi:BASS family bile acid:Na+ symporter [Sinobacterium caligoides]|uniref:BASS family bile acid:Na+ symporter n=1 Tax=Sinobacterium caligoides TaxID=933926 RepID=A0A3N2DJL9_9GAMM|nr:bile acid:sodium symporter [Sinobacterium caligoides]ROR99993.1 BASS family bile acid:Na+ symporter [Sinobacterium caligoides]